MSPARAGAPKRAARPVKFTMGGADDGEDDEDNNDGWYDQSAASSSRSTLDSKRTAAGPICTKSPSSPVRARDKGIDGSSATAPTQQQQQQQQQQQLNGKVGAGQREAQTGAQRKAQVEADEEEEEIDEEVDDDSDAWSSETDDSDEEREKLAKAAAAEAKTKARAAAAAEEERKRRQRQREEEESNLFKKRPIRSQSAADVSLLGGPFQAGAPPSSNGRTANHSKRGSLSGADNGSANPADVPNPPVRGILTSIFHPEQAPHSPPGQLMGRPHASAADLRQAPHRTRSPPQQASRRPPPASSAISNSKRRSYVDLVEYRQQATGDGAGRGGAREGAGGGGGSSNGSLNSEERVSRRLSSPKAAKEEAQGGGLRTSKSAVALPVLTSLQLKISPSWTSPPRSSVENVRPMGAKMQESQQRTFEHQHSNSTSALSNNVNGSSKDVAGSKSADIDVPARRRSTGEDLIDEGTGAGRPLTPKTTRRNMIQHELSESLRENLLWERQNRQRMLGIGAIGPLDHHFPQPSPPIEQAYRHTGGQQLQEQQQQQQSRRPPSQQPQQYMPHQQQQSHHPHQQQQRVSRGQSVLSGGLRPLTSSTNMAQQASQSRSHHDTNTLHRNYTGDFHVSGW